MIFTPSGYLIIPYCLGRASASTSFLSLYIAELCHGGPSKRAFLPRPSPSTKAAVGLWGAGRQAPLFDRKWWLNFPKLSLSPNSPSTSTNVFRCLKSPMSSAPCGKAACKLQVRKESGGAFHTAAMVQCSLMACRCPDLVLH
eukprot:TRINITY_DN77921_c0_g1_i1.p2 TRINITY_DN77921_c0_g1~~TRINITY_DN77921_c0_g1_i1.p2  ORF type:complete len:142 (+),score=13.00 TRINITY_DN77921_c0_g1_i1:2227-2652(+)